VFLSPLTHPSVVQVLHYLELADALDRSGIGTSVKHQRNALQQRGVEVVETPWRRPFTNGPGSVLSGAIEDADIVHCNAIGPGTLAVAHAARRADTPLVLHAHVTAEDFRGSFRLSNLLAGPLEMYLRRLYSLADVVCCPSEYTRRTLASYPIDAPVRTVSNGVDSESLRGFESLRSPSRERFGLSGMGVFAVGNVFERKGVSTFCRLAQRTSFDFAWFGPYERGPLASRTVRRWTNDPPANVTFTGWVDDIRGGYAAGDVFLFPTHVENQGIAVLEAMACGKPVVLRRLPVFEEYYTHGEDCLLCETFAEFRDALIRLRRNPALRERLGANARQTAQKHSLDRVGAELLDVYQELLD